MLDVLQKLEGIGRCSNEICDIGLLTKLHVHLCHFYLYNSMATLFLSYHNIYIGFLGMVHKYDGHDKASIRTSNIKNEHGGHGLLYGFHGGLGLLCYLFAL